MRGIKLTFTNSKYVDALMNDNDFKERSAFLNPQKLDGVNIRFNDPIQEHNMYDTEDVVLALVGYAIKRILFPDVTGDIAYNYPYISQLKGGINLNGHRIVSSTDVEVAHH